MMSCVERCRTTLSKEKVILMLIEISLTFLLLLSMTKCFIFNKVLFLKYQLLDRAVVELMKNRSTVGMSRQEPRDGFFVIKN